MGNSNSNLNAIPVEYKKPVSKDKIKRTLSPARFRKFINDELENVGYFDLRRIADETGGINKLLTFNYQDYHELISKKIEDEYEAFVEYPYKIAQVFLLDKTETFIPLYDVEKFVEKLEKRWEIENQMVLERQKQVEEEEKRRIEEERLAKLNRERLAEEARQREYEQQQLFLQRQKESIEAYEREREKRIRLDKERREREAEEMRRWQEREARERERRRQEAEEERRWQEREARERERRRQEAEEERRWQQQQQQQRRQQRQRRSPSPQRRSPSPQQRRPPSPQRRTPSPQRPSPQQPIRPDCPAQTVRTEEIIRACSAGGRTYKLMTLKIHPDKNPGCVDYASQKFKLCENQKPR